MKHLGIDYGTKRIGIAVSDEGGSFAFPHAILPNDHMFFKMLKDIIEKESIVSVVIGESLASNGLPNEVVESAAQFAKKLQEEITVPIIFEREGYSSVEAYRYQQTKGPVDDSAAAVILQRYLDKKR